MNDKTEQKALFLWLGADGEVEDVTEEEFMTRIEAQKAAWDAWVALKDLEPINGTIH